MLEALRMLSLPRILNIPQKCQNSALSAVFFKNTFDSWTGTEERKEFKRTRVEEAPAGEPLVAVTVTEDEKKHRRAGTRREGEQKKTWQPAWDPKVGVRKQIWQLFPVWRGPS